MPYTFSLKLEHVSVEAEAPDVKSEDSEFLEKGLTKATLFTLHRVSDTSRRHFGSFYLSPMPGCCGVVVVHNMHINPDWRGSGLSNPVRELKELLCKKLGYSCMIATTQMSNIPAVGNMMKSKYKFTNTFVNKRTSNLIGLGVKLI